jgi:lipopolysaccharide export system permease protein
LILQRYIYREITHSFLAVFALLLPIYLSNRFVQYLAEAAAGKIGSEIIFKLLGLKLLSALVLILPLCLYLATYLALRRLKGDNELIAMASFGLDTRFMLGAISKIAVGAALIVAVFSLYIAPWAEGRLQEIKTKAIVESDITGITAGRFKEFSQGDRILYVESISKDNKRMDDVFLHARQDKKLAVLTSDSARFEVDKKSGDKFAVFSAGRRYMGTPGQLDYSIAEYQKYGVRLDFDDTNKALQESRTSPTARLLKSADSASVTELQWRLSMPIHAVILALTAVMLVKTSAEQGRFAGLLTAILVYFIYSNLLGVARSLTSKGDLSIYLGLWWVHALLIALILSLYFYPALRRMRSHQG